MSAGAAPAPGVRCHGTDRSVALPQSRQAAASAQAERVPGWAPSRGTDCVWPLCRRAARPPSARPPHARCHPCGAALSQIADVLTEHESCSKQHAVLQFRRVTVAPKKKTLDATVKRVVKCVCCSRAPCAQHTGSSSRPLCTLAQTIPHGPAKRQRHLRQRQAHRGFPVSARTARLVSVAEAVLTWRSMHCRRAVSPGTTS